MLMGLCSITLPQRRSAVMRLEVGLKALMRFGEKSSSNIRG